MDSHQIFSYGVKNTELFSYEYPQAVSEWMTGTMKFDAGTSPTSPLSTHLDSDNISTTLGSSSWEKYGSAENLSGISPSANSPLDITSSFYQQMEPPPSTQLLESAKSYDAICRPLKDVNCLKGVLSRDTGHNGEICTAKVALGWNKSSEMSGPRSRACTQINKLRSHLIKPLKGSNEKYRKLNHDTCLEKRHQAMMPAPRKEILQSHLSKLLIECARALSENRDIDFDNLIQEARKEVSITGEPIQRLGAYIVEGLVARKEASGPNLYRTLRSRDPESKDLLSYMHTLYDMCPYFKFGYMAANGAIAQAFKNEDRVHIIDFQIAQGTQWVTLIQALAARPGGPPHVRITGIDDPVSRHSHRNSLDVVGKNFDAMSKKFNIPIEFHGVPLFAPEVTREMLDVRPGEALAVNFAMLLHHTPDESVDVNNPRDGLLRMVRSLSPKVTTLVEQESNTNTTAFFTRFVETMNFYSAMFESIDVVLPKDSKERINVEQLCLARDIVNIIACEDKERVERHELLGKWKSRLTMAGFRPYPLSPYINAVIRRLMRYYSQNFIMMEKDGAMLLGWKNRSLISASAWH